MSRRLAWRLGALFLVGALAACDSDKTPGGTGGTGGSGGTAGTAGTGGTGGSGGSAPQDSGTADTGSKPDTGGPTDDGGKTDVTTPPDGGGLAPCLDRPGELERAPSGRLPCDLLPPGFKAP